MPRKQKRTTHDLMIKDGIVNGQNVKILIDSGASNTICRSGLGENVVEEKPIRISGFDGKPSKEPNAKFYEETLEVDGYMYKETPMIEWNITDKDFDFILGQPWFRKHNPQIDWITQTIESVSNAIPVHGQNEEVMMMKICQLHDQPKEKLPVQITQIIEEFQDVFPEVLPDKLPPERSVQFDLTFKPNAKPCNRPPFRLAKVEQASLDKFVDELKKKGWIELSTSDWVSNIFGVPKKDENGKMPSRQQWLKTATADTPIRWVLDYRYVNSQTEIPQIPLPNIEDLFDRMHGCYVFTKIDLASGYHQMLVVPSARKYTAFRTHKEILQWCVAPMGMSGMPGIWSRLMRSLFDKFPFVVVYLDDICIFSHNIDEHAIHFEKFSKSFVRKSCMHAVVNVLLLSKLLIFLVTQSRKKAYTWIKRKLVQSKNGQHRLIVKNCYVFWACWLLSKVYCTLR